jgi:hypothetical protein
VNELCRAQINPEHVGRLTNRAGGEEAARQAVETRAIVEPTSTQVRKHCEGELRRGALKKPRPPALLQVGLDGGWTKSREQKRGMESKVGVIGSSMEALCKRGQRRMTSHRYVATFESASVLGTLSYADTCKLGAEEATRQVIVAMERMGSKRKPTFNSRRRLRFSTGHMCGRKSMRLFSRAACRVTAMARDRVF